MRSAKSDQSVVIVERHPSVGGGCTHWGTIPSKALRHAVQQVADYRADPLEKAPLKSGDEAKAARAKLQAALDRYEDARPAGMPWPTNNRGAQNEAKKPKKG